MLKMNRQEIIQNMADNLGACEVKLVEDSLETARHVCIGGKKIWLLPIRTVPFTRGFDEFGNPDILNIEYFFCESCRKLFINKNTLC